MGSRPDAAFAHACHCNARQSTADCAPAGAAAASPSPSPPSPPSISCCPTPICGCCSVWALPGSPVPWLACGAWVSWCVWWCVCWCVWCALLTWCMRVGQSAGSPCHQNAPEGGLRFCTRLLTYANTRQPSQPGYVLTGHYIAGHKQGQLVTLLVTSSAHNQIVKAGVTINREQRYAMNYVLSRNLTCCTRGALDSTQAS